MTTQQFRRHLDSEPFQPFVIHLADGGQIPVTSRQLVGYYPGGRTFAVAHSDTTISVIDLLLVTRLETKPTGNGTRKGRRD